MATNAEARAALARLTEQAEAQRSKNGTIVSIDGRRVSVVLDGDGAGVVTAHRGIFEPVIGARVKITRMAGTRAWKVMGVADDALMANDPLPYDFENQGEKLYFPVALEAINNASYNLDATLGMTVYNFQVINSDNEFVYTASQVLDFTASIPAANSRWSVVYGDASTGVLAIYDAPSTATPDGEWVTAVNLLLTDIADAIPVLAVRLDAGMTAWGDSWRSIKRGYLYGNKKIVRIPAPVQPTAGTVITDAYYQTIEENGVSVPSRPNLNFTASGTAVVTVTDDGVDTTNVNVDATGLVKETFTDLDDTPTDYVGHEAKLVRVNATEDGLEFVDPPAVYDQFTDLTDTPAAYTGHANKLVTVKADTTGLEFTTPPTIYDQFTDLTDTPAVYTGQAAKMVTVKADETGLEFVPVPASGGASAFTDLTDAPSAYTGHASKVVSVKADETGLEFVTTSGGGSGAPDNARYIVGAGAADLSAEVIIPGLLGSPDIAGAAGGGITEEYDTATTGLTWVNTSWVASAPDAENSNSQALSHLYVSASDLTDRYGMRAWAPAGAFDARTKLSLFTDDIQSGINVAGLAVADAGGAKRALVQLRRNGVTAFDVQVYTINGGTTTQRGATMPVGGNAIYLRMVRDASNNFKCYWSSDGLAWSLCAAWTSATFNLTVAEIGYRLATTGSAQVYGMYSDWLRTNV